MVWGFLTALSRFTAVMNGAEIWDVVERGPNFMLPAALVYMVYKVRQEGSPAEQPRAGPNGRPTGCAHSGALASW